MQRIFRTSFLLLLLLAACAPRTESALRENPLSLDDCALTSPTGNQVDARCGTLTVPEDRSNPGGRQIDLKIAVIPAIKRNPEPDALFLLAGGPGQSAIEAYPAMIPLLFQIHEDRDIVLVDQRGTGESNPLRCLDPEDEALTDEQATEKLKACPETLDADLRFYTTEIAMTDLDEVRSALGYEVINIYGASYGTRAALTYLRMFPEHVRTVTLDAVVDSDFVMFMDAAQDGQAALLSFFARCETDAACNTAFPELRTEFEDILSHIEENPAEITIPHPLTAKPLELTVTRRMITDMVFNTLYVPDLVATLPVSIHAAYEDENYVPLISQALLVNAGLYDGMFYAVTCTEDAPLISANEAADRAQESVFGDRTVDFTEVCARWPKGEVSPAFREPVSSDIPVLIFSGRADPITPPRHVDTVAESLSNEKHLLFEGMAHGNLSSRCSVRIFRDFLERASTAGLDTSCVESIQPPPFFVDFSGPRP
ncbi:MAG TPA: alpha/beta fold hydrolase [Anaerolineales bacterium]|nr:alpha/beta fold hydrolase [Anaerolineales bacterium]